MALLTTYSDANKQQIELPVDLVKIGYYASATAGKCVKRVITTTTQRFAYVGMDKTTAQTCVDAMVLAYTDPTTGEVSADVQGSHVGGGMWQVDVGVRQTVNVFTEEDWPV